eukprot:CAMPEP_0175585458 /NCGR_PEP_ID=MMETSP0096-20121207/49726_1 /TAXON_ID=311494 /ORGANISM="Alexandrium monilatum, Strain CCMP3105" /LENGTH=229 /DNA_ID=CAMNT_0016889289 /DNA_START=6 /DNA_END=692 /DNA_ORIENTATION=+
MAVVLPNGEWRGWYNQARGRLQGSYQPAAAASASEVTRVEWTKQYIGQHRLKYMADVVQVQEGSRRVLLRGSWHIDPPASWEGSRGTFELLSVNPSRPAQPEAVGSAGAAQAVEGEDATVLVARLAEKVREVAELRQRLQAIRGGAEAGNGGGSVAFHLARTTSSSEVDAGGQDSSNSNCCIVCMDALRNCVLLWCGHQVLCLRCAQTLVVRTPFCPICRGEIANLQQV